MAGDAFFRGGGDSAIRGAGDARAPGGGILMWYDCSQHITVSGGKVQTINDQTEYLNHLIEPDPGENRPDYVSKSIEGGSFVNVPYHHQNSAYDYQSIYRADTTPPTGNTECEVWLVAKVIDTGGDQQWFYYWGCPTIRVAITESPKTYGTWTLTPDVNGSGRVGWGVQHNRSGLSEAWRASSIAPAGAWHILRITCSESEGWRLWYNNVEQTLSDAFGGGGTNIGYSPFRDAVESDQTGDRINWMSNSEPGFYNAFQWAEFKILDGIQTTDLATAFYNELVTKWAL